MPRPHLPAHLSSTLQRFKGKDNVNNGNGERSSPPSRQPSPPRNGAMKSTNGNGSISSATSQGDHKNMGLVLRVQVLKGRNLAPKDKSGTSDPFLVLTLGDAKEATSVVSKTLNPEWNQTFELPITTADNALLEAVCWDKDRFRNDYMGEFDLDLEDIFHSGTVTPEPAWLPLQSKRSGRRKGKKESSVSGEVLLQFTLYDPLNTGANSQHLLQKLTGVVADPLDDEDGEEDLLARLPSRDLDDLSEEDDDKEPSDGTDDGTRTPLGTPEPEEARKKRRKAKLKRLRHKSKLKAYEFSGMSDVAGVLFLEINRITDLPPEKNMTRTTFDMDPFVVTSLGKKTYRTKVVRHSLNPVYDEKLIFQVQKHEINYSLNFAVVDRDKFSGNDFVGTANFPVDKIKNLAPEADPETGLYRLPDPDHVTASEEEHQRRRRFRIPLSRAASRDALGRSSRNNSQTNLSRLTRNSSSNSLNNLSRPSLRHEPSSSSVNEQPRQIPTSAPTSDPTNPSNPPVGLSRQSSMNENDDPELFPYDIPLDLKNKQRWEEKHKPVLYIRAKYLPYQALRQQFWRVMLRQYDADESGKIDKVELVTMLDTLGSTLHNSTIDGFFTRWKVENNGEEYLTMDQAVISLEEQLQKSVETQKSLHTPQWRSKISAAMGKDASASSPNDSPGNTTPRMQSGPPANLGPNNRIVPKLEVSDLGDAGVGGDTLPEDDLNGDEGDDNDLQEDETKEEHVVEIHECPICHQPRLARGKNTTDADIVTHIATCASSDWRAVNNLVMAGFVTSSQAQRKWYSKVISKVSYGGYKLGANSANILVQDRITGMINEERMSVYVRLGIRLLYKGLKSRRMEKDKIRKLLRSLSFKQGRKYDDPASASQIPGFINFHQLNMGEVLEPIKNFRNFNEFFYRKLKPDARPCSAPENSHIIVSPADCRSVVFNRMDEAQRIWVKGREFSVERLLGSAYPEDAKRYHGGSLGIFRLAPQDYHRFHIPVDGVMGKPKLIDGEYYTVNPMAIRSALDVYGENIRVVVPIDTVSHRRVMVICVGAMMVGSTVITREPGDNVRRGEELGYFKFGGSTILLLCEPGVMQYDADLASNSAGALETLISVGMSIGHSPGVEPYRPDMQKQNPTNEEVQDAKRRIEGSLAPSKTFGSGMPAGFH
ncbi:hypothetical protein B0A48_18218 [Cryoendolithus antarcticus]|uniref:Phosphatidylserine decarboxylase proenzyme 2 n=1 Tax=Cryoendolithus antarcticus TaxID=1507870 RepID=A0A1V8S998_9PEZI|nr:hypothetical protein B0A48_18218 [Cryoendolithus antarcticus]